MASVITETKIGLGDKNGGVVTRGHIFFIITDPVGVILTFKNIDSGVKHSPKKSGRNLANTTANVKLGFALTDDIGFFETGFQSNFAEVFNERKFFAGGNQDTVDNRSTLFDVKVADGAGMFESGNTATKKFFDSQIIKRAGADLGRNGISGNV